LDGVLRAKLLEIGIVNGMDVYEWDPSTYKYISVKYDATTVRPIIASPVLTSYGDFFTE
jgi:glycogen synthase